MRLATLGRGPVCASPGHHAPIVRQRSAIPAGPSIAALAPMMLERVGAAVRGVGSILHDAWSAYRRHRGSLLGAALAFYTLLSIAPLLVVAVALAGMLFGQGVARAQTLRAVDELAGARATEITGQWMDAALEASSEATIIGTVLFFLGASRVFVQLEAALDTVWDVPVAEHESLGHLVRMLVGERLLSFALMLGVGVVIAGSLVAQMLLDAAAEALFAGGAALPMRVGQVTLLVAVLTVGFALTFRRAPHRHVGLRETWLGSLVTAILFTGGNALLSAYFARAGVGAVYGAAGSIIAVLVWLLYSAQIVVFGAELTRVVAMRGGRVGAAPGHAPTALVEADAELDAAAGSVTARSHRGALADGA
jgi:membrane protein